jgi:hypothetical protein
MVIYPFWRARAADRPAEGGVASIDRLGRFSRACRQSSKACPGRPGLQHARFWPRGSPGRQFKEHGGDDRRRMRGSLGAAPLRWRQPQDNPDIDACIDTEPRGRSSAQADEPDGAPLRRLPRPPRPNLYVFTLDRSVRTHSDEAFYSWQGFRVRHP